MSGGVGESSTVNRERGRTITVGETMATASATRPGPLRHAGLLELSTAGAESTVAIGLTRLGHDCTYLTRVGDDELGRLVVTTLRGEGLDLVARVDESRRTGLMLREQRTSGRVRGEYWRAGSAASALSTGDVDALDFDGVSLVHVTGITLALSPSCAGAVERLVARAREVNATVSLDVNHRDGLWSRADAATALSRVVASCDIVFASADEVELLGVTTAEELLEQGPSVVAVTDGGGVATVTTAAGTVEATPPAVTLVDPLGAGDAFVVGYLSGHLDGLAVEDALARAVSVAAVGVSTRGDWEGLPRRDELRLVSGVPGEVDR